MTSSLALRFPLLLRPLRGAAAAASPSSPLPLPEWLAAGRKRVARVFWRAWDAYTELGFPHDELAPLSCSGVDTDWGDALTVVDTLDTLLVLGAREEFVRWANWTATHLRVARDRNVSVFESSIRILGGLLSAHLLAEDVRAQGAFRGYDGVLLRLAAEVADRLLPAFDTATGIPYGSANLLTGVNAGETNSTCTAGGGSFLLEFGALSVLTGDMKYYMAAKRAAAALFRLRTSLDLLGNHIDIQTGRWLVADAGVGHGIDSYLEYLLKAFVLFDDRESYSFFRTLRAAAEKHLRIGGLFVEVNAHSAVVTWPMFDSLQCFWPGLLSLDGDMSAFPVARQMLLIWKQNRLAPEKLNLLTGQPVPAHSGYPLRPEMIESLYYLGRVFLRTTEFAELALGILDAIEDLCSAKCGYAGLRSVPDRLQEDRMFSYFLGETLKYLYLIFDPDNFVNRGNYVFTTEAHLLPVRREFLALGETIRARAASMGVPVPDAPVPPPSCSAPISTLWNYFLWTGRESALQCSLFLTQTPATPAESTSTADDGGDNSKQAAADQGEAARVQSGVGGTGASAGGAQQQRAGGTVPAAEAEDAPEAESDRRPADGTLGMDGGVNLFQSFLRWRRSRPASSSDGGTDVVKLFAEFLEQRHSAS